MMAKWALALCIAAASLHQALCFSPISSLPAGSLSLRKGSSSSPLVMKMEEQQPLARRAVLFGALSTLFTAQQVMAQDKALSPAEMEEYQKLLKQAFRIQSVIDANVEANKQVFEQEQNGVQEYLKKKREGKLEASNEIADEVIESGKK